MKIIAAMPARNESWCVEFSIRAAMGWCDEIAVLNHASTDATPEILLSLQREFGDRVHLLNENGGDWDEATFRQRLLVESRRRGATHIALIDADEALTANSLGRIRDAAATMNPGVCFKLPWLCMWRSLAGFRSDDSPFGRARVAALFCDSPDLSFQPGLGGYQIHCRVPAGAEVVELWRREEGGVIHLQHASWRRLMAKQLLYCLTERIRWNIPSQEINARYRPTANETGLEITALPVEWRPDGMERLDINAAPWQEARCRSLIAEYGAERFSGIELLRAFE